MGANKELRYDSEKEEFIQKWMTDNKIRIKTISPSGKEFNHIKFTTAINKIIKRSSSGYELIIKELDYKVTDFKYNWWDILDNILKKILTYKKK